MKIIYFSWLKSITNVDFEEINNDSVNDINSLKKFLSNKYPKLKKFFLKKDLIRIAINLEYITKNNKLSHNDEIAIFPPVSGG